MDSAKVKEVFADRAFAEQLLNTEQAADAQKLLAGRGIDMTTDDVVQLGAELVKYAKGEKKLPENAAELSDAELSEVSGGIYTVAQAVLATTIATVALGAAMYGAYSGLKAIDKATKGSW